MLLPCSAHSLFIIPLQINGSLGSISIYPLNHCSWVVLISRISYKSLNIANIWTFISIDSLWTKCYMRPHLDNLLSRILRSTRIRRTWHRSSCSPPTVWSTCSQSETCWYYQFENLHEKKTLWKSLWEENLLVVGTSLHALCAPPIC